MLNLKEIEKRLRDTGAAEGDDLTEMNRLLDNLRTKFLRPLEPYKVPDTENEYHVAQALDAGLDPDYLKKVFGEEAIDKYLSIREQHAQDILEYEAQQLDLMFEGLIYEPVPWQDLEKQHNRHHRCPGRMCRCGYMAHLFPSSAH